MLFPIIQKVRAVVLKRRTIFMDLKIRSFIFSGMIFISPMKKPEFDAEANEDVTMGPSNAEALDQFLEDGAIALYQLLPNDPLITQMEVMFSPPKGHFKRVTRKNLVVCCCFFRKQNVLFFSIGRISHGIYCVYGKIEDIVNVYMLKMFEPRMDD